MAKGSESKAQQDVIDLLLEQHQQIRWLFAEVESTTGKSRAQTFDVLRRLLAVHETAEEEVVHPFARRSVEGGAELTDARLAEEKKAKQMLSDLERMGPDHEDFIGQLQTLRDAVLDHAEREEREEFPQIREQASDKQQRTMATAVKAAEAMAPTHPHPGVESAAKNVAVGPVAAVIDRARDLIRETGGKPKA
jgi:hemerythrin superfamily protein